MKLHAKISGLASVLVALGACSQNKATTTGTGDAGGVDGSFATDGSTDTIADTSTAPVGPLPTLAITARSTRFVVREHMLAAVEMQLSGEPFAEAMGRTLSDYSRDYLPPDIYFDTSPTSTGPFVDLPGFSSAVESYEYSKQPMNNLAFESGAGISLAYGPVLNPSGVTGAAACSLIRDQVQHLGGESNGTSRFIHATVTPTNPLGWPGVWPTSEPFMSFDPTIVATNGISELCSITSDDDPGTAQGSLPSDDYECDATTLHLTNRAGQVDSAISPGSSGWAGWKSALWVLNYLQVMHDSHETGINGVAASDLANVGIVGNQVLSNDVGDVPTPVAGTFLGSSDIEGFQAGMMLSNLDNQAQDWLTARMTTDGATLGGFPDLTTALAYDVNAPLRWFPSEIAVTETIDPDCFMPRPTAYTIRAGGSHLLDIAGLLGTYSSLYALTDEANSQVGGSQPAEAYFDGDPFPVDDQLADGEATLHDRALSMIRVSLVDLARMHLDTASGLLVDEVTLTGTTPTRGTTISTPWAAYALLSLRTTRRSLNDQLTLYTNTTPDTAVVQTILDAPPIAISPTMTTITAELNALILAESNLFYDHLTDATGRAYSGWDVSKGAVTATDDSLDSHTAAVRGLLVAFLATGDTKFRDRALAVYNRADSVFFDPSARLYRPTAGDTSNTVTFTPLRFVMAQAMLRDIYELVASKNGDTALATTVLSRLARLNTLVLNGWDDHNGNEVVDNASSGYEECMQVAGGVHQGGLQMAERTLSGETGSAADAFDAGPWVPVTDREDDCVPNIAAVGLPSALADSITITITPASP